MRKTITIIAVATFTVITTGCLPKKTPTSEQLDQTSPTTQGGEEKVGVFSSLKEAASLGNSRKCTWKSLVDQSDSTVYMKDDKVYMEGTSEGVKSHTIVKNNCSWTWSDGESEGVTVCHDEELDSAFQEGIESLPLEEISKQIEADTQMECTTAIINDSRFDPPSEIKFINLMDELRNLQLPE